MNDFCGLAAPAQSARIYGVKLNSCQTRLELPRLLASGVIQHYVCAALGAAFQIPISLTMTCEIDSKDRSRSIRLSLTRDGYRYQESNQQKSNRSPRPT